MSTVLIQENLDREEERRLEKVKPQGDEENCTVPSNVVETKPTPELRAARSVNWDDYEAVQFHKQRASFQAIGNQEDAFRAAVESSAHWNRMYREAMEVERERIREWLFPNAQATASSASDAQLPDVSTASSWQPSPDSYSITDAANFIAYEAIKNSELWSELSNSEWDAKAEKLAGEILEFVDGKLIFPSEAEALNAAVKQLREKEDRLYQQRQQLMKRLDEIE